MAQSKSRERTLKNQITIKIWDDKGNITFKEPVTQFQLMASYLILKELVDFHMTGPEQAQTALQVYERIQNIEEVET